MQLASCEVVLDAKTWIPRADQSPRGESRRTVTSARLKQLAEKVKEQIPRGLKPARNEKTKRLRRWPKGQLYPIAAFFRSL